MGDDPKDGDRPFTVVLLLGRPGYRRFRRSGSCSFPKSDSSAATTTVAHSHAGPITPVPTTSRQHSNHTLSYRLWAHAAPFRDSGECRPRCLRAVCGLGTTLPIDRVAFSSLVLQQGDVASPGRIASQSARGRLFQHRYRSMLQLCDSGLGQPRQSWFRCRTIAACCGGAVSLPRPRFGSKPTARSTREPRAEARGSRHSGRA